MVPTSPRQRAENDRILQHQLAVLRRSGTLAALTDKVLPRIAV